MSVNKVQLANGETIIDISDSTVTPETLAEGVIAHDASGQKITGRMVPGGGASVQSDWNQTDETAADFIKNKPFGDELTEVMPETELIGVESDGLYMVEGVIDGLSGGEELVVKFDGVEHRCSPFYIESGMFYYGNSALAGLPDNGMPFVLGIMPGSYMLILFDADMHRIGISLRIVNKLHHEYVGSNTVFYNALQDKYLYTDKWMTTKATKADVRSAAESGTIVIQAFSMTLDGFALAASVYPSCINLVSAEYAIVVGQNMTSFDPVTSEQSVMYTAEYTG